jgi:hypothetical protein
MSFKLPAGHGVVDMFLCASSYIRIHAICCVVTLGLLFMYPVYYFRIIGFNAFLIMSWHKRMWHVLQLSEC